MIQSSVFDIMRESQKNAAPNSGRIYINHITLQENAEYGPDVVANEFVIIKTSQINSYMDEHFVIDAKVQPRAFSDVHQQLKLYRSTGQVDYYLFPNKEDYEHVKKYVMAKQVIPASAVELPAYEDYLPQLPSAAAARTPTAAAARTPTASRYSAQSASRYTAPVDEVPVSATRYSATRPDSAVVPETPTRYSLGYPTNEAPVGPTRYTAPASKKVVQVPAGTVIEVPSVGGQSAKAITLTPGSSATIPSGTRAAVIPPSAKAPSNVTSVAPFDARVPLISNTRPSYV